MSAQKQPNGKVLWSMSNRKLNQHPILLDLSPALLEGPGPKGKREDLGDPGEFGGL